MAGSYPDVPARRMAWHADGTVSAFGKDGSAFTEHTGTQQTELNDEDNVTVTQAEGTDTMVFIFPELREFDGIFICRQSKTGTMEVLQSGDTTNGIDGTFAQVIAAFDDAGFDPYSHYRTSISSTAVNNVRSVRIESDASRLGNLSGAANASPQSVHLYGEISAGETPDRLLWVDNDTGSEFGLPIDYGDVPRGSAEDTEVKLRNNSGSLTASSVQVTASAPYLNSDAWYTFKEASGSFQSTLALSSSIGAGSDSPVITIRRVTPDDETLGLHAGYAHATVGSWS